MQEGKLNLASLPRCPADGRKACHTWLEGLSPKTPETSPGTGTTLSERTELSPDQATSSYKEVCAERRGQLQQRLGEAQEQLRQLIARLRCQDHAQRARGARSYLLELEATRPSWRGPFLSKGKFPYWYSEELYSWSEPDAAWEEHVKLSRRMLCSELSLEPLDMVRPSFRAAAKGVVAVQSLRHLAQHHHGSYSKDQAVPAAIIEQIDLDIPRTASGDPEVLSSLGSARALLLRQVAEDPELGYCQGMNLVAALFAVAAQSQSEAYMRFRAFLGRLRGLWQPGFPLLRQGLKMFEALAEERPWFQHLNRNGVEPDMYLPRAWLGLFSCWLPLATRVLLLRSLEEGMEPLLALTLAILDHVGGALLEQGDDMDGLLRLLDGIKQRPPHPLALLTAQEAWRVRASKARRPRCCREEAGRPNLATAGQALLRFCLDFGRH